MIEVIKGRLDGHHITPQIYLKVLLMICLAIKYHLLKKKIITFSFEYILHIYTKLIYEKDKYVLKMINKIVIQHS